jgi:dTDP-4-dehydrorhamnose reductase
MLGNYVFDSLTKKNDIDLMYSSKQIENNSLKFDALRDNLSEIINYVNPDFVINCIAYNPRKPRSTNSLNEISQLLRLNTIFPRKLAALTHKLNFKLIQIQTDGVFSGKSGGYDEKAPKDATDWYGLSKTFGEVNSPNILNLRCSIIGEQTPHSKNPHLVYWLKSQPLNSEILGFSNYFWNGVTAKAFAKIIHGFLHSEEKFYGSYHLIPKTNLSKLELLSLLKIKFNRSDLRISPFELPKSVNRTLSTNYSLIVQKLWYLGGYESTPTIKDLIDEL